MENYNDIRNNKLNRICNSMEELLKACDIKNVSFSMVHIEDFEWCISCALFENKNANCTEDNCSIAKAKKWSDMGFSCNSEVLEVSSDVLEDNISSRLIEVTDLPYTNIVEKVMGNIREIIKDNEKRALQSRLKVIEDMERIHKR